MCEASPVNRCTAFPNLTSLRGLLIWSVTFSLALFLLPPIARAQVSAVPNTFFGMQMTTGVITFQPWPADPFGAMRMWDTNTSWAQVNIAQGVYTWNNFDLWLSTAQANGVTDVLYTFGSTPQWASSNPADPNCRTGPGQCDPPNDLNADGSGTNQHWKDYVTAVALHAAGRIKYWEIWNEANLPIRWNGTMPQLIRLAADARSIICGINPTAMILTPSVSNGISGNAQWIGQYLSYGGGTYADVISFHGYVQHKGASPVAEDVATMIVNIRTTMKQYGQQTKPLWDTEASWGDTSVTGFTDPDQQASFAARYVILHWSSQAQRFYWFQWNSTQNPGDDGTLWIPDPNNPSASGTLLEPGITYGEMYKWLVGATLTAPCVEGTNRSWTCHLTRPSGYDAWALWNCSSQPVTYTIPPQYNYYRDKLGNELPIPGNRLLTPVCSPLLVESAPLP